MGLAGWAEDLALLRGLMVDGKVTPVVGRTYPLDDLAVAVRYVRDGHATGKVAVTVNRHREPSP